MSAGMGMGTLVVRKGVVAVLRGGREEGERQACEQ